jgi:hypothetical protein
MPGLGFDDYISVVFSENSIKPFVTQTYVDDPAIISMVEHGQGISMLSALILSGMRKSNAKFVRISPSVCRDLSIVERLDYTPSFAAKRLIAIAKDTVKSYDWGSFGDFE